MTTHNPHIYQIPIWCDYLPSLLEGLWAKSRHIPQLNADSLSKSDDSNGIGTNRATLLADNLAGHLIILPTDRACHELRHYLAFRLDKSATEAQFLPKIISIDRLEQEPFFALAGLAGQTGFTIENPLSMKTQPRETDELLTICPDFRRQLWLAGQIRALNSSFLEQVAATPQLTDLVYNPTRSLGNNPGGGKMMDWPHALALAASLAELLDEMTLAESDLGKIKNLVPDNFAAHWQKSLQFFQILTDKWPQFLHENAYTTRFQRQNAIIRLAVAACQQLADPNQPNMRQTQPDQADTQMNTAIITTLANRLRPLQMTAVLSANMPPMVLRWFALLAKLPNGQVIIPGLDADLSDHSWAALTPSHPQYGFADALRQMRVARAQIQNWPYQLTQKSPRLAGEAAHTLKEQAIKEQAMARARLMSFSLDPLLPQILGKDSGQTQLGQTDSKPHDLSFLPRATDHILWIDCAHPLAEAEIIALHLYEAWQNPHKRAALVTPDRELARRVAAELKRFGIISNDSGGIPILDTPPGVFMRLILAAIEPNASSVALLALLKHPFCLMGYRRGDHLQLTRLLERKLLRGPRIAAGIGGLRLALQQKIALSQKIMAEAEAQYGTEISDDATLTGDENDLSSRLRLPITPSEAQQLDEFLTRIERILGEFQATLTGGSMGLSHWLDVHVKTAMTLCRNPTEAEKDQGGTKNLFGKQDGKALKDFIDLVQEHSDALTDLRGMDYRGVFEQLASGQPSLRRQAEIDQRIAIWGLHETHLKPDLVILGGLNEQTWPKAAKSDPWLNRPMRQKLGLASPDCEIGRASLDFTQYFTCGEVIITRSERVGGEAVEPSRFLRLLDRALTSPLALQAGAQRSGRRPIDGHERRNWAGELDRPEFAIPQIVPSPTIPESARILRFSASQIEALLADPYAFYAQNILEVRKLPEIAELPDASDRGLILHAMLEQFITQYPTKLPDQAPEILLKLAEEAFKRQLNLDKSPNLAESSPLWAFWQSRFRTIAHFAAASLRERQNLMHHSQSEIKGKLTWHTPLGAIQIHAKADRIEWREDHHLVISDYKTGNSKPIIKDVINGKKLQLLIYGLIAAKGGFPQNPLPMGGEQGGDHSHAPVQVTPKLIGLEYWHLSGRENAAKIIPLDFLPGDIETQQQFFAHIERQLRELIQYYATNQTQFTARLHDPDDEIPFISRDYAHLSRVNVDR